MPAKARDPPRLLNMTAYLELSQRHWPIISANLSIPLSLLPPPLEAAIFTVLRNAMKCAAAEKVVMDPALVIKEKHLRVRSLVMLCHLFPPLNMQHSLLQLQWHLLHPGITIDGPVPVSAASREGFLAAVLGGARGVLAHLLKRSPPLILVSSAL